MTSLASEIAELEALAEKATPGPWTLDDDWTIEVSGSGKLIAKLPLQDGVTARYIVAAYPARIQRVLARLRKMEQALKDIRDPLAALGRYAESKGSRLSGMAYQIANDPNHLKEIARAALEDET